MGKIEFQVKMISNYSDLYSPLCQFYDDDNKTKEIQIKLVWKHFYLKFILTHNRMQCKRCFHLFFIPNRHWCLFGCLSKEFQFSTDVNNNVSDDRPKNLRQGPLLHFLVCSRSPEQSFPFPLGGGLVQVLVLVWYPSTPQGSLQADQLPQGESPPSAPVEETW